MSSVKLNQISPSEVSGSSPLTENDLELRRFLELDHSIKAQTRELDALKEQIKHRGSYSTSHFVATVETRERAQVPTIERLESEFGPRVRDLCGKVEFKIVRVARKGE